MLNHDSSTAPLVSVIIPFFNDTAHLESCLKALDHQTYPKDRYEVIVVDNGSDVPPAELIQEHPQARLTEEPRPGSYAARNKGISLAKGPVIAFTDADCVPDAEWIEKGVAALSRDPQCGLVAGKIRLSYRHAPRLTAVELLDKAYAFRQLTYVEKFKFGATANVFTWKSVIEHVGEFNGSLASGGDREWGERVAAAGYKLLYDENVCVEHPARYTLGEISRKNIRVQLGYYQLYRLQHERVSLKDVLLGHLLPYLLDGFRWSYSVYTNKELKGVVEKTKVWVLQLYLLNLRFFVGTLLVFGVKVKVR